jgi:hypothetical protein
VPSDARCSDPDILSDGERGNGHFNEQQRCSAPRRFSLLPSERGCKGVRCCCVAEHSADVGTASAVGPASNPVAPAAAAVSKGTASAIHSVATAASKAASKAAASGKVQKPDSPGTFVLRHARSGFTGTVLCHFVTQEPPQREPQLELLESALKCQLRNQVGFPGELPCRTATCVRCTGI